MYNQIQLPVGHAGENVQWMIIDMDLEDYVEFLIRSQVQIMEQQILLQP